jgi:hypothetical protein
VASGLGCSVGSGTGVEVGLASAVMATMGVGVGTGDELSSASSQPASSTRIRRRPPRAGQSLRIAILRVIFPSGQLRALFLGVASGHCSPILLAGATVNKRESHGHTIASTNHTMALARTCP